MTLFVLVFFFFFCDLGPLIIFFISMHLNISFPYYRTVGYMVEVSYSLTSGFEFES